MATLADLKARVILETDRDDMGSGEESEDALTNAIARAVEFYSSHDFWFNRDNATVSTVAGTGYVVGPYAVRLIETVAYQGEALQKVAARDIEYLTDAGRPSRWAENGGLIQLWPIPDAVYSLSIYGTGQFDAPEDDDDESVWTNEAYDLIAARVRFLLCRDTFRDVDGAELAQQAETEELDRLRKESRRRGTVPLRSDLPVSRATFNIYKGW